ncbi:single-stranded DNA-binding protein [Methylobacter sp. Wu8]|jgi:single-strand DNA-binding protein|uniref:Single-stranded DNA-binding protein n=1 Tax=Methylobacter tundripaludum TaxID=173365 RepID=A0A2S6H4B1_9GAMM|nr:single-stranded DNA-binding protein [Methylobacter tundripaludum]MCF7964229.1 single-stranded DNA-binding protein [Methylobacter tundripaludum]MCK9396746.1 single-stranded DNA-binding protein [Methylobacter sp.]MCK9636742.1 single-stranded DNA-binding protein [Methylobacter tundripaludum]PPK72283.1 single-strand binding protein [Methylobacter tundripaludum]
MSNVFSFTGTVGRDAEVRYLPSGQAVLNVTVANNIGFGDKQQTLWIRCAVWGKRAEGQLQNYLKKGQQVFVSGELSQSEYRAQDGSTKTSLELNANIIDLVGRRNESGQAPQQNYQPSGAQGQPSAQQAPSHDNFDAPYDDDIPF